MDDVRQWKTLPEVQFCQRSAVCSPFTSHCCKRDAAHEQSPGRRHRSPLHPQEFGTKQPRCVLARVPGQVLPATCFSLEWGLERKY